MSRSEFWHSDLIAKWARRRVNQVRVTTFGSSDDARGPCVVESGKDLARPDGSGRLGRIGCLGAADNSKGDGVFGWRMVRRDELAALERRIRRNLSRHLQVSGFTRLRDGSLAPPAQAKETIRTLHSSQRREHLREAAAFVKDAWPFHSKSFAAGTDVTPNRVSPYLEVVHAGTEESDLFRLATLTWRVPVSNGYGRRIRYIIWDESNWKILGLFAIGDPVFNQRARDIFVGWTPSDRFERLVDVMDAFVMGAIPPYNSLLGGKVVACLVRTKEVKREFARRYSRSRGVISGKRKHAELVLVTTSSALGKSSVYDRLKLGEVPYFQSIGFTEGWGHFHVPDRLFDQMRLYLAKKGHRYALNHEFGDGPNWRLRATRAALKLAGWNEDVLRHGIRREVYACRLATNAERVLRGEVARASYSDLLGVREVSSLALARWVLPRALRRPEYLDWTLAKTKSLLDYRRDGSASLIVSRAPPLLRIPSAPPLRLSLGSPPPVARGISHLTSNPELGLSSQRRA